MHPPALTNLDDPGPLLTPVAAASLLFANQWWWLDIAAGSNLPYWSMSFEAAHPILAILAGVAAGLASNFHMSRRVFAVKL